MIQLHNIIAALAVGGFPGFQLLSKNISRSYVLFVIAAIPIVDLFVTPPGLGHLKVFHLITIIHIALSFAAGNESSFSNLKIPWSFTVFIMGAAIGSIVSEYPSESLLSILKLSSWLYFGLITYSVIQAEPDTYISIVRIVRITALIAWLFLIGQFFWGLSFSLYDVNPNTTFDSAVRFPGFTQDPQLFGQYLALSSLFWLYPIPNEKKVRSNLGFMFTSVAILFTGSRAALFGYLAGLLLLAYFGNRLARRCLLFITIGGLALMVLPTSKISMFNRSEGINATADTRVSFWQGAGSIFRDHPLTGIGFENYQNYVADHDQEQYWKFSEERIEYVNHPESGYLKLLVEFGLLPCLALAFWIISLTRKKYWVRFDAYSLPPLAALLCWLVGFLTVYSFMDLRIVILLLIHLSFLLNTVEIRTCEN